MHSSVADPCTLDTVRVCIAWLDNASSVLNPQRIPHHSFSVRDMHDFTRSTAPPPSALQEQWNTQVWSMPGEPYEVYLLRCLAHQSGVTLLSPHFSFDAAEKETVAPKTDTREVQTLYAETCVVVGLRVEPTAKNLLQTGWDTQPCPYCPDVDSGTASARQSVLPLLYGGDTCGRCGRAFPLVPTWTRMAYLVLQRGDRTRVAAVAYGDGVLRHLTLGATIRVLLYRSQTEQQEPLLVIHAAHPAVSPSPSSPLLTSYAHRTSTSMAAEHRGFFRAFYDDQVQSGLVTQMCAGPFRSLDDVANGISPKLLGQTKAKKMILLVVMYTLYCSRHFVRDGSRRPLHLLLLGPAKAGKSALLRGLQALMGAQAEVLDSTVVRSAGKGEMKRTNDGASFLSAFPVQRRDLLLAGPAMTATTLVLDQLPTSSTAAVMAPLKDLLERQTGCIAVAEGAENAAAIHLPVHLIAAAEEENRTAVQLAPYFSLVTSLTPTNSLGESALISQDVVAASRARASCSRSSSCSASSSSASCTRASPSSSQRSASLTQDLEVHAVSERLTADDVQYLLRRAAGPGLLNFVMGSAVCYSSYMPKLVNAAALVEEAQLPVCALLPPPSSCRGSQPMKVAHLSCHTAEDSLSASPLCFGSHLRVLHCLSQARLMLETPEDVRAVGWTTGMRDEVWQLYEHHLVTLADLLHQRSGKQHTESARAFALMSCASEAGNWAPWPSSSVAGQRGNPTKKLSKKKLRLLFAEELRRCQSFLDREKRNVILPAETEQIYAQLGGSAAFGDLLDAVMYQLCEEGLVLRRLGGWQVL